jgi:hypothetical protein
MQLLAGMLVFTMGAYFFAERAAQRGDVPVRASVPTE